MKRNKDLRSYARRVPTGNVYAALGRDFEKFGKIIDLSPGGLGFVYIPDENQCAESFQIDIFKVGEVFHLHNLPCRIAYDVPLTLPSNGIKSLKNSPSRRCGVEFRTLPEEDNVQLEWFLELHTKSDYSKNK